MGKEALRFCKKATAAVMAYHDCRSFCFMEINAWVIPEDTIYEATIHYMVTQALEAEEQQLAQKRMAAQAAKRREHENR